MSKMCDSSGQAELARELLVYFDKEHDPAANIRRESEIFEAVDSRKSPECLRFWVNSRCLIRGEARAKNYGWYDEKKAAELGIPVVTRSTGGGVVYHDEGNLNWSFFLHTDGSFVSPMAAFERGSAPIIRALDSLGVPAKFSPPNRIDVADHKVSGMAARSTVRTLLVHGTLLLNSDIRRLNELCIPPPGCPPVANLSKWVDGIDSEKVAEAVVKELEGSGYVSRIHSV